MEEDEIENGWFLGCLRLVSLLYDFWNLGNAGWKKMRLKMVGFLKL